MKIALTIGLAVSLGMASTVWAFDQDALNSKKALVTYGKIEMKEKNVEKTSYAAQEKAAPKKATVAVTRDCGSCLGDRDLGKADTSRQNSKKALTTY